MEHFIFAYGTLKTAKIRKALLNRVVPSDKDTLSGFTLEKIYLDGIRYPIAVMDPFNKNQIHGEVFKVTLKEIQIIDDYESDAYQRIIVNLNSGRKAWIYTKY